MAARPPTGDPDEPDTITFGIAALDARLDRAEIDFPADADAITGAIEDTAIAYDPAGHTLALSEAIDRTDRTRFEDEQALLNALHPVFEAERRSSTTGLLARLRSLF